MVHANDLNELIARGHFEPPLRRRVSPAPIRCHTVVFSPVCPVLQKKDFPSPLAKMAVAVAGGAFPPNANKGLGGHATTKDTAIPPTIHAGSTPVAKDGRALEHQQQTVRLLAEARKN